MATITIHHFSDILCIWAHVSQIRMDELKANFGQQIEFDFRTLSVFGNVPGKMESAWSNKGGVAAYAAHVREIAAQFPHVTIHPDVWTRQLPQSSLPAHLYLCALKLAEQAGDAAPGTCENYAGELRAAFFAEALDVSAAPVLKTLLASVCDCVASVEAFIANGHAYARLAKDLQMAKDMDIRSSPTLVFNEGRQRLAGNVGYRIIEANIRELIDRPQAQHSWC